MLKIPATLPSGEIVAVDVDELAFLEALLLDLGLAAEVTDDTHHEWQFLVLDRITDLDVVRHLDPRWTHFLQALLNTFFFFHAVHPAGHPGDNRDTRNAFHPSVHS